MPYLGAVGAEGAGDGLTFFGLLARSSSSRSLTFLAKAGSLAIAALNLFSFSSASIGYFLVHAFVIGRVGLFVPLGLQLIPACGIVSMSQVSEPEGKAMKTLVLTAPSFWASYLINGDASGISDDERVACDTWLAREGLGAPVDCEDAGFCKWHDALNECPFSADCQTYTFLVEQHRRQVDEAQLLRGA
jgi:hypothetical protein